MSQYFKSTRAYVLLIVIVTLAYVLRMYHLAHMVSFDADQEFAVTFAKEILTFFPIRLIGQGLSIQSLFMGPWYFYYLVPFFALTKLHPIGGYIGSIVLGLIITIVYFFTLKSVFGIRVGLITALIRAILFDAFITDYFMTPAFSSELAILLTWFAFYKYWHGQEAYLVGIGFIFGMYTSFHPILFPFYIVFLVLLIIKKSIPKLSYFLGATILFLTAVSPLLLFEYFHKFLEVKALFSMKNMESEIKTLPLLWEYIKIILYYPVTLFSIHIPKIPDWAVLSSFYSVFFFFLIKRTRVWKDTFHTIFVIITTIVFILYYFLLPVHVPEYYFQGVKIIFFIYSIAYISLLLLGKKRLVELVCLIVLLTICNSNRVYAWWTNPYRISLYDKEKIIKEIIHAQKSEQIQVYYDNDVGQHFGLGYLIRYNQLKFNGGPGTPEYIIVVPATRKEKELTIRSGNVGLIIKNAR